jgi:hypothetical protein
MSELFCPQCGRKIEPDSEVRFCRYCGLAITETRDNLRGFSEVKREGYKFINVSFVLAAILFWVEYFEFIPWDSVWGGRFFLVLIFGFIFGLWFMGNWVVDRPAKYLKTKNVTDPATPSPKELPFAEPDPAADWSVKRSTEKVERTSVTDNTTRELGPK